MIPTRAERALRRRRSPPRSCRSTASPSPSPASAPSTASRSASTPARSPPSSARTAPASRPSSRSSPASTSPTPATSPSTARPTAFPTPHAAAAAGVTAIHQETVLFDDLSVAENIYLGHAPRTRLGLIDWTAHGSRRPAPCSPASAPPSTPRVRLRDLGIANKHLVAVARALSHRRPRRRHGRAHRRPLPQGDRRALRPRRAAQGRGQGDPLHLATSSTRSSASPTATPSSATARWSARASWRESPRPTSSA